MHRYDNLIPYQVSPARRACVAVLSRASREQVASKSRPSRSGTLHPYRGRLASKDPVREHLDRNAPINTPMFPLGNATRPAARAITSPAITPNSTPVSQVLNTCEHLPRPYSWRAQVPVQPRIWTPSHSAMLSASTLVSAFLYSLCHRIAGMIGQAKANSSGLASLEC